MISIFFALFSIDWTCHVKHLWAVSVQSIHIAIAVDQVVAFMKHINFVCLLETDLAVVDMTMIFELHCDQFP